MTDKPPWRANTDRERQWMVDWTKEKLDEGGGLRGLSPEHAARLTPESFAEGSRLYLKWQRGGGPELELAHHGNIKPARELVRKVFPYLADLVQLPKLKRGEKYLPYFIDGVTEISEPGKWRGHRGEVIHRPDVPFKDLLKDAEHKKRLATAVATVTRIKRIWAAPEPHGYGKTNRRRDQVSAIDIAAERHGVTTDELAERLKRT
jgi:hypothetical protein